MLSLFAVLVAGAQDVPDLMEPWPADNDPAKDLAEPPREPLPNVTLPLVDELGDVQICKPVDHGVWDCAQRTCKRFGTYAGLLGEYTVELDGKGRTFGIEFHKDAPPDVGDTVLLAAFRAWLDARGFELQTEPIRLMPSRRVVDPKDLPKIMGDPASPGQLTEAQLYLHDSRKRLRILLSMLDSGTGRSDVRVIALTAGCDK
ncbi:MAG: hypothetical protein AAGA48_28665 [Myxococcota bacterium]